MDSMNGLANNCQVNNSNGSRNMNQNNSTNNGNGGSGGGHMNSNNDIRHTYTIPGIVQFLQYEWQRFELRRQQWEVEKSELQARISLLQGERKGQENLKNDLIRRIKMLEYCLRQERAKYHLLKHGVDAPDHQSTTDDSSEFNFSPDNVDEQNNVDWKQGRQVLRQYLQEVGYSDTIIDVRSNRVRSLLGLSNLNEEISSDQIASKALTQTQFMQNKKKKDMNSINAMVNDTETSVLATFDFLHNQTDTSNLEGNEADDEDIIDGDNGQASGTEMLNEFDMFLNNRIDLNDSDLPNWKSSVAKDVDIGELASLTEPSNIIECNTSSSAEVRKTWNQKFILKSHYDCIRALRFHAVEPLLITASEDETIKLWNLNKTQPSKNRQQVNTVNATLDLEPVYTYRGNTSRVLSLAVNGNLIYSGSQNGQIVTWSLPANIMNIDSYDSYDSSLQVNTLEAHSDAVWSLSCLTSASNGYSVLCSASSDGTIKIWDTARTVCTKNIVLENGVVATDLYVLASPNLSSSVSSSSMLLSSFDDGSLSLFDLEAGLSPVLTFERTLNMESINSITVHPTMPIVISAHKDKHIRLWDINTGKCIHSMVAHLDEVTSVDCDPNGLYLLSGSHDCSVRLWNFDNKNCVQEITAHRKKFDEAIFDVTFHPSKPYFASAGADALAKVFV